MKLSNRQYNFIRIAVEVTVIIVVICVILYFRFNRERNDVTSFDENWTVTQDETKSTGVKLSEYEFPHIMSEGDVILLQNVIPKTNNDRVSISLLVYLSTVEVYLDDVLIYEYGEAEYQAGEMVGSGYHFIALPDNSAGKTIKIVICSREDRAFSSIPAIEIIPTQSLIASFARQHIVLLFVSLFLVVLGILLMINSLFGIFIQKQMQRLIWIGAFSFLIGIWSLATSKTLQIFSMDLQLNTTMEYISLYLAMIPLLIQMYTLRKDSEYWKRLLLWLAVIMLVIFAIVASLFHFTNTIHYCGALGTFHVIMVISLIIIIIAARKPLKDMDASDRVLNIGFVALFATGVVDLIRFVVQKYLMTNDQNLSKSILPIGALIFIVLLLMSYLFFVYNNILEEENRKTLTQLAYHDRLTGLYNRAKYIELLDELTDGEQDYVIVNMDLNGLKVINDTYGHSQGDLLLTTFANNLKDVFKDEVDLVRIGGDEFCIIGKEGDRNGIEHSLLKLTRVNRDASKELPFDVSAAYGVASSGEVADGDAEGVYRLADKRMYDMKIKMKQSM
ncbi:MAG: diguanylate cyclase [Lachnospiraceae bacterium]|nr:diguanylate cyclase [Lachnospiraceae bacterium]